MMSSFNMMHYCPIMHFYNVILFIRSSTVSFDSYLKYFWSRLEIEKSIALQNFKVEKIIIKDGTCKKSYPLDKLISLTNSLY